jgi:hypothetical protein
VEKLVKERQNETMCENVRIELLLNHVGLSCHNEGEMNSWESKLNISRRVYSFHLDE